MSSISENGLLEESEYRAYKQRSVHLKFLGQLFSGLAGATFFALLTKVGGALLQSQGALAGLLTISPWAAAAFIVVGAACTYLATKSYFESNLLDSDFNAKKIADATRKTKDSPETEVAVAIENDPAKQNPKPTPFPQSQAITSASLQSNTDSEIAVQPPASPQTTVTAERAVADTIVARGAANENSKQAPDAANARWQDKALADKHEPQTAQAKG